MNEKQILASIETVSSLVHMIKPAPCSLPECGDCGKVIEYVSDNCQDCND